MSNDDKYRRLDAKEISMGAGFRPPRSLIRGPLFVSTESPSRINSGSYKKIQIYSEII